MDGGNADMSRVMNEVGEDRFIGMERTKVSQKNHGQRLIVERDLWS